MRLLASLSLLLAVGCNSPCQRFCSTLATYAEEECETSFSDADIDACEASLASATAEQEKTCREFGDPRVLRNEWTCDDLNLYRDGGGGGSDTN